MTSSNPPPPKSNGLSEWAISTEVGLDMQRMEPWFVRRSPVLTRLLDVYGDELDHFLGLHAEVIAQMFVRTSTWGLTYWELELGLPYVVELTDADRADRIVAKMRSYRQGTPYVIQLVANSFNLGHVTPIEDYPGRRLIIRFDDIRGVPPALASLQDALEHLVRASAILEYQFSYMQWQEVKASTVLWGQLQQSNTTWEQLRGMAPSDLPTDTPYP